MAHRSYGAVALELERRFGGPVREEEAIVAVGVARIEAAPRDPECVVLLFVNLGATTIFVAPSQQVSATRGIRLGPNGGLVGFNLVEDAHLPSLEWTAIGDLAGGSLYRLKVRRETATPPDEAPR